MQRVIDKLDSTTIALVSLANAVKKERMRLQEQLSIMPRVLHNGIAALPNEILSQIVELSVFREINSYDRPRATKCLSAVSRRFRDLCLRLPAIWASFDSRQKEVTRRLYLQRSAPAGLSLSFFSNPGFPSFTETIAPHFQLVHELNVDIGEDDTWRWWEVEESSKNLAFPALRTLHLKTEEIFESSCQWTMPVLQVLSLANVIPRTGFSTTISSLKMCLTDGTYVGRWNLSSLAQFLRCLTGLIRLSLELEANKLESTVDGLQDIVLSNVEEFDLSAELPDEYLRSFMGALHIPAVTTMAVQLYSVSDEVDAVTSHKLRAFFAIHSDFRFLKHFSFEVQEYISDGSDVNSAISIILGRLQFLSHLSLSDRSGKESHMLSIHKDVYGSLRSLRSLQLEKCDSFDGSSCGFILGTLKSKVDRWDLFRLKVTECPTFNWRATKDKFPDLHFAWEVFC